MPGRIDGLPAPEGPQRTRQNETRRTQDNARNRNAASASNSDRVDLSETAQDQQDTINRLRDASRELSDIREDRVAQARARIAAGDYNTENMRRIIADRILTQFGLSDT